VLVAAGAAQLSVRDLLAAVPARGEQVDLVPVVERLGAAQCDGRLAGVVRRVLRILLLADENAARWVRHCAVCRGLLGRQPRHPAERGGDPRGTRQGKQGGNLHGVLLAASRGWKIQGATGEMGASIGLDNIDGNPPRLPTIRRSWQRSRGAGGPWWRAA